ncbi:MAG: polyprenol monophosphomannose synthase [Dehalococcoidia bacterium]|nr:polyprenol monophosphomannose synthase [Dehalococcoidia bacterium]
MASLQKVIVVVPTYNEAGNLAELAAGLFGLRGADLSLLVVDDNSPDGTGALAEELTGRYPGRVHVLHRPGKLGLGTAYEEAFRFALQQGASAVVQMDADLSHSPSDVLRLLAALGDADVSVGSRYAPGGRTDPSWGASRRALSWSGNLYARLALGLRPRDVTSGFKAYRREALERLDLRGVQCRGFAFQTEVAYRCKRAGLRVSEVPILFVDRSRGASKMSRAIVLEALWRLPQLRWQVRAKMARLAGAAVTQSKGRNRD